MLHRVLLEHLETFLDRARTEYHELPKYAPNELRDYVKCGVLAYGSMRNAAAIEDHASIKRYLDGTNENSDPPILKPARPPPQIEFDYEHDLRELKNDINQHCLTTFWWCWVNDSSKDEINAVADELKVQYGISKLAAKPRDLLTTAIEQLIKKNCLLNQTQNSANN